MIEVEMINLFISNNENVSSGIEVTAFPLDNRKYRLIDTIQNLGNLGINILKEVK